MDQMREWFGEFDGKEREIDTYVRAFRFVQAEALRYISGAVRYADEKKAGMIVWMGNEPFPNAANTSVLEYDGCPKPAYFELKRTFAHNMLGLRYDSIVAKEGVVRVTPFLRCDDKATRVEDATLTAYDMSGKQLASYALPADGAWEAMDLAVTGVTLVRMSASSIGVCTEYVFVPEARHPFSALLEKPAAVLTVACAGDTVTLTNTGDAVALYCDVTVKDAAGQPLTASDGNLCLLPGESRCVVAQGAAAACVASL